MKNNESLEERLKRFKSLSSKERKILIRKKLELKDLTKGYGLQEKDDSYYEKEEMIDLIILTRCFKKQNFNNLSKKISLGS